MTAAPDATTYHGHEQPSVGVVRIASCEHVFVTSQGSAYSQFKRALSRGNFLLAWTLAADLTSVPLADALALRIDGESYRMRAHRAQAERLRAASRA